MATAVDESEQAAGGANASEAAPQAALGPQLQQLAAANEIELAAASEPQPQAPAPANESEQGGARARENPVSAAANAPPLVATLDPRLLWAARRGDSQQLRYLLHHLEAANDNEQGGTHITTTAAAEAAAAPQDGVTIEGDSLLHVVAGASRQTTLLGGWWCSIRGILLALPMLLKDLLHLNDDDGNDEQEGQEGTRPDDGSGTPTDAAASTSTSTSVAASSQPHVIVEVDRRSHDAVVAPLPPPAVPVLDDDGVTIEGGSLGHSEIVEEEVVEPPSHDDVAPARQPTAGPSGGPLSPPVPVLDEDGVTMEGDSLLHVVAACGDTQEYLDCAKMMVRNKKHKGGADAVCLALEARNSKGDTPLHCAAGAGNANMISCLVDLITNSSSTDSTGDGDETAAVRALVRMQNERGETALHQAVRAPENKQVACIDQLMDVDPELACVPDEGGGASPLYLAISLGEIEIARHLYVKSKGKLSYSGRDGRNVLHAAVCRGQALPMILEWLKGPEMTTAAGTHQLEAGEVVQLLLQLTSQRDKQQKGSTPLHLAASLDCWPDARLLSRRFPQVWLGSRSATTLLLHANESTAYQADDEGMYPIHVAAAFASLDVVKTLLERCPDCATLRDVKGRTFLHVAARRSLDSSVVQYVCGEMPQQLSRVILNAQDSNGDTALHGAVRAGNLAVFNCLLRNPRVRLDVANKDGMTPLDLSWTMIPAGFYYRLNPRGIVRSSLLHAGAPHGGARPELLREKHMPKRDLDKESKKHTEATQVMSIVTALIATVTFASVFTLPGGYRADGEPVLAGSYAFDAFILADTLAFICSISSTCTLVYAGVPAMAISLRNWYFNVSAILLQSAARSLVAAFGLGLYLVVHHTASAIAACAIVFASSLYGNMGAWRIIRMAYTVLPRIGISRYAVVGDYAKMIFFTVLIHFWSYLIIFGLPAIRIVM